MEKSLLQAVGRELLMLSMHNGASSIARRAKPNVDKTVVNKRSTNKQLSLSYHIGLSKTHSCVRGPALCLHPGPARPRSDSEAEMVAVVAARP